MSKDPTLLLIMVGHAGVGKSHFAKLLAKELHYARINADAARIAIFGSLKEVQDFNDQAFLNRITFGALDYAATSILESGKTVIYDSANSSRAIRSKLYGLAKDANATAITIWITAPYNLAVDRTINRAETADQRKKPDQEAAKTLINKHISNLEEASPEELVIKIDDTQNEEEQLNAFQKQLDELIS